ncbi:MAG: hypothetical protein ABI862_02300 [Ilumatobacteraceae bacterium]
MPYDPNDPRSQLASTQTATQRATAADSAAAPEYFEFSSIEPDSVSELGSRAWYLRSQTGCLVYSDAVAGERLSRSGQVDEYVTVLVSTPSRPAAHIDIVANDESASLSDDAIVVVPPGDSEVVVTSTGTVVRVFSNRSAELAEGARNASSHAGEHPHAAPFAAWPAAPAGDHLRVYRMADVPVDPSRFGNIFRCSTVMINVINADPGARNPGKMSPHFHDDFEQLSLQIDGDYVHHIRTPWTTNLDNWRADEHQRCSSPALIVIPPPTIHTSQGVGDHRHQLIDIFCPPRLDFSLRPGWVLNHDDYPDIPPAR